MTSSHRITGFTLIELSIVMVVIGLMVGAVVGGRALIHQAELNKVISDLNGYKTAFNAYVMQYNAMPGDHIRATQFWPGRTSNGNGDGLIWDTGMFNAGNSRYEDEKSFNHLGLAEIIPFRSPGTWVDGSAVVIGVHLPKGPFKGQGYRFESMPCSQWGIDNGECLVLYGRTGARIVAGKIDSENEDSDLYRAFLTPADARNIDSKIDDGMPASGQLMADDNDEDSNGDCVKGKTGSAGEIPFDKGQNKYNVSKTTISCNLQYWMQ